MSRLYLKAENLKDRTVISDCFFTAPIKIAKPFYYKNHTEIMMMAASAGILDGDFYDIELEVCENAALKFTGQSYTKLFKATNNGAEQKVKLTVKSGGKLLYFPTPVIPFCGSIFKSYTEIYLSANSKFAMLDVISCGRKAMNEEFQFKIYRSRIAVYIDNRLKFLDNQRLMPEEAKIGGMGFFEGFSHTGMMYIYGKEKFNLPECQNVEAAITNAYEGLCIRIFANSGDEIVRFANKIIEEINF